MAHQHTPAPVSEEEVQRAATTWTGFTRLLKVSLAATIVVLVGMALFLL